MTEDQLFMLSDEELEARFNEAKASEEVAELQELELVKDVEPEQEVDIEEDEEFGTDEEDEDEVAEMEQPDEDEDSDNDASADEDEEETEEEDSEDVEEEETTEEEEQPESEEDTEEKEAQPVQSYSFKANGKEYTFSEEEMKSQFPKVFGQAMDYTKKMQAIKPWRKTIDAIEQASLKHDDVNLMIDVLKGDKGAISEVLKRTGIDSLELDTENYNYVAKDYGRDDSTLAIKDVIEEISADREYETTHRILEKEWDDKSWKELSSNPEMIRLLHIDVKNGMYKKLQPVAEKLKLYDRGMKSDIEYYEEAAKMYHTDVEKAQEAQRRTEIARVERETKDVKRKELEAVKAKRAKSEDVKKTAAKRKAAAPVKKTAGTKKVVDYLDESDEAFDEWYNKVQSKM